MLPQVSRIQISLIQVIESQEQELETQRDLLRRAIMSRLAVTARHGIKLDARTLESINAECAQIVARCKTLADIQAEMEWFVPQRNHFRHTAHTGTLDTYVAPKEKV